MSGSGWEPRSRSRKRSALVVAGAAAAGWAPWGTVGEAPYDLRLTNTDFLECPICFLPMKPPIFQCAAGHVLCSPCCDKLESTAVVAGNNCYMCGVALAGGRYQRSHALEHAVGSVRAPYPHAPYGCGAIPVYHDRDEHITRECRFGPCHCPDDECGFVGSTAALLDHVASAHKGWPCVIRSRPPRKRRYSTFTFNVDDDAAAAAAWYSSHEGPYLCDCLGLRDGFNLVVPAAGDKQGRKYIFLLNVVRRPTHRAVSVVCIRPAGAATEGIKVVLKHRRSFGKSAHYSHKAEFTVECSDLSDGLPDPNQSFQLFVPKCAHGDGDDDQAAMEVKVKILKICPMIPSQTRDAASSDISEYSNEYSTEY